MIEYDYKIVRYIDEKDGYDVFVPDQIPNELPNLAYIEGPNSSGKSTLLHILALGLYGLKNKGIVPQLKIKMEDLLNIKHQKITFKICLTNSDGSLKLVTEKKNPNNKQIDVYEIHDDGKVSPLAPEAFRQRYKLIYDIPFDPTDRLKSLTKEIRARQEHYGNKVGQIRLTIREIIADIIKSDPQKLETEKKRLLDIKKDKKELEEITPELEVELDTLEKSFYFKYYEQYKREHNTLKKDVESLKKTINKKTKVIGRNKTNLSVVSQRLRAELMDLEELKLKLIKFLNLIFKKQKDKYLIEIWERIDFYSTIEDGKFPDSLDIAIDQLDDTLIQIERDNKKNTKSKEIQMYQELINLLENYKNLNLKLPGLNQSITDFLKVLENLVEKSDSLLIKLDNINKARNLLNKITDTKFNLNNSIIAQLKELRTEIDKSSQEIDDAIRDYSRDTELKEKKKKLDKVTKLLEKYKQSYIGKGEPIGSEICVLGKGKLKEFGSYSEEQLNNYIKNLRQRIKKNRSELIKLEEHEKISEKEVKKLLKIKPHKYQSHKVSLQKLLSIVTNLESKIKTDFALYIKAIENKSITRSIKSEQKKYNSTIFNYLGKIIDNVFHIDKTYKVKSVDLLEGIIYTEEGKQIWLSDMGTGQSQSAYLKSLLSTSDDRTIIALFDEVAAMDSKSLKPIYEKMKELNNQDRILAGIVVQKADKNVKIVDLVK